MSSIMVSSSVEVPCLQIYLYINVCPSLPMSLATQSMHQSALHTQQAQRHFVIGLHKFCLETNEPNDMMLLTRARTTLEISQPAKKTHK
eukprot:491258-Amphidinium_carterae.1